MALSGAGPDASQPRALLDGVGLALVPHEATGADGSHRVELLTPSGKPAQLAVLAAGGIGVPWRPVDELGQVEEQVCGIVLEPGLVGVLAHVDGLPGESHG